MIISMDIYHDTIIGFKDSLSITLFFGLISYLIDFFVFRKAHLDNSLSNIILNTCIHIGSVGFISCYIFLAVNYYFTDSSKETIRLELTKQETHISGRTGTETTTVTAVVKYKHKKITLYFPSVLSYQIQEFTHVDLVVQSGYLGYPVFTKKSPIIFSD